MLFPFFFRNSLDYNPLKTSNTFLNKKRLKSGSMMQCRDVTYSLTCFLKMFCRKSNLVTDTVRDRTFPCIWALRSDIHCFCLDCTYGVELTELLSWVSKKKTCKDKCDTLMDFGSLSLATVTRPGSEPYLSGCHIYQGSGEISPRKDNRNKSAKRTHKK